ncbi:hypothetical protein V6N11_076992 [Hibiscus sabdariffa]|uniref:Uncharacterized protein n=1 Tax=Hibiscus sabdariffa TaxID=183260 RepID=A0ABR2TCD2_9ROSI
MGGRPSDFVLGEDSLPTLENEVTMVDLLDTGKQSEYANPDVAIAMGVEQDSLSAQETERSAPSFKEKLLSNNGKARESHSIDELDVEVASRRCQNVNVQGPNGINGGFTKEKEVMGSRFMALSTNIPDEDEDVVELQPMVVEQGSHELPREPGQGKLVGIVNDDGKILTGQDASVVVVEARGGHVGGVKNITSLEPVLKETLSLNIIEKHATVYV